MKNINLFLNQLDANFINKNKITINKNIKFEIIENCFKNFKNAMKRRFGKRNVNSNINYLLISTIYNI
jgi:hypothetical protein